MKNPAGFRWSSPFPESEACSGSYHKSAGCSETAGVTGENGESDFRRFIIYGVRFPPAAVFGFFTVTVIATGINSVSADFWNREISKIYRFCSSVVYLNRIYE